MVCRNNPRLVHTLCQKSVCSTIPCTWANGMVCKRFGQARVDTRAVHTRVRTRSPGAHSRDMVHTVVRTRLDGFGAHKVQPNGAHKVQPNGAHKGAHKALGVKGVFANYHTHIYIYIYMYIYRERETYT